MESMAGAGSFIKSKSASALDYTKSEIGGLFDKLRRRTSAQDVYSSEKITESDETMTTEQGDDADLKQGSLSTSQSCPTSTTDDKSVFEPLDSSSLELQESCDHMEEMASSKRNSSSSEKTSCHNSTEKLTRSCDDQNSQDERAKTPSSESNLSIGPSKSGKTSEKKKKGTPWYTVLSPNYKSKTEDFKRIFKTVPSDERLIVDYSCAIQKDILTHGRLYVTQNYICFFAKIFGWETVISIKCKDITGITKERTARVIPNAIQITTKTEKYFFTSLTARDKSFLMLFRVWQNALMEQPMPAQELWQWVHLSYGEDLGLTSSDDDYVQPSPEEENMNKANSDERIAIKNNSSPDEVMVNGHERSLPNDNVSLTTTSNEDIFVATKNGVVSPIKRVESFDNPEIPTDMSDQTEESEEGSAQCTCDPAVDHRGMVSIDKVYCLSVDQMFEHLFTDSKFFRDLLDKRKTFDLVLSPWPDDPEESGNKVRMITYTLSLNAAFGPKTSPATETQTLYSDSKPGSLYIIDCEAVNSAVPYGDSFFVVNRYCITRISNQKCRLLVHSEIKYKTKMWGVVKSVIDKNVTHGIKDYFKNLDQGLQAESIKNENSLNPDHAKKKVLRRRRAHSRADDSGIVLPPIQDLTQRQPSLRKPVRAQVSQVEKVLNMDAEALVKLVGMILLLLLLFNAILFYKLWGLESSASVLLSQEGLDGMDLSQYPKSQEEWVKLLQQQQYLHDSELDRWKNILSASMQLMSQMQKSLEELHNSIERRIQKKSNG